MNPVLPLQKKCHGLKFYKQIDEFYKTIKKHKLYDIISTDETWLNAYEVRKHFYETIGKRCIQKNIRIN